MAASARLLAGQVGGVACTTGMALVLDRPLELSEFRRPLELGHHDIEQNDGGVYSWAVEAPPG